MRNFEDGLEMEGRMMEDGLVMKYETKPWRWSCDGILMIGREAKRKRTFNPENWLAESLLKEIYYSLQAN